MNNDYFSDKLSSDAESQIDYCVRSLNKSLISNRLDYLSSSATYFTDYSTDKKRCVFESSSKPKERPGTTKRN